MPPGQPYFGPIALAESKYASPRRRKEVEILLATTPGLKAQAAPTNVLAIREQITTADNAERAQSDGVRLAHAQSAAIEQEVTRHTQQVERTVSTVYTTARQVS